MTSLPRIGVVGTGWWATQFHIPSLVDYEGADLVALADTDESKLRAAAEHYSVDATYTDPAELYASGSVDGVLIAVPHAYHYRVAKAALDAGMHVLLEKPMTLTAVDAHDLQRSAEERDLHLMIGYTYQWTRGAAAVRRLIQSGYVGELVHVAVLYASMVEAYYRGRPDDYEPVFKFPVTGPGASTYSDPVISGGGQGVLQVTHAMCMVLWATGRRVEEVSAFMSNRDLKVDLVDAIAYRLDGGAVGTMASTGSLAPGQPQQQEFRYYGTEGYVLQDLLQGTVVAHRNDGSSEEIEPMGADEVYPAQLPSRTFADLIAGYGENLAPAGPAVATVEFLEAAYRSVDEGRPVRIDELVAR